MAVKRAKEDTTVAQAAPSADDARLAEYETLRAESDRIAQLLSNAVWVGVTGFGLTFAGAAAFADNETLSPLLVPIVALMVCIQALAISIVYASELWKYVRVGTYIREYIEAYFQSQYGSTPAPMQWESWIDAHRARALHLASLALLQSPFLSLLVAAALLGCVKLEWIGATEPAMVQYVTYLSDDSILAGLIVVVCLADGVAMVVLGRRLVLAERGDFGDGGRSLRALRDTLPRAEG